MSRSWTISTVDQDLFTGGAIPIIAAGAGVVHIAYWSRPEGVIHATGPAAGR